MINFNTILTESKKSSNTPAVDVNEILLGYYALGSWTGYQDKSKVKQQLNQRKKEIEPEKYELQDRRAEEMAKASINWAHNNGYKGNVTKVWWTARPESLSKIFGFKIDSRSNPTDTLFQFQDGQYLGVSAKSTKNKGELTFISPGIGTFDKDLGLSLSKDIKKKEEKIINELDLPKVQSKRKAYIKANPDVKEKTDEYGKIIMMDVRDKILQKLSSMSQEDLRQYILSKWLRSSDTIYPRYIVTTGRYGEKNKPIQVDIKDPMKNSKLVAMNGKLKVYPVGTFSIGIEGDGTKLFKCRVKYEDRKIASTIKLNIDGWS